MTPELSYKRDEAVMVLVVDDATDSAQLIMHHLQNAGFRALSAESGALGISIAEKYVPEIILLDIDMPGMDGFEVCRELKGRLATSDIPVLFVTGVDLSDELIERAFNAGIHDIVTKPVRRGHLIARLRVILRDQALRETYRSMATRDAQTGLDNRRQFLLYVRDALSAARRDASPSYLALADIKGMAAINELYGYEFGDEVILTFARIVRRFVSPDCRVGRVSGDTVGIVLKHCTEERALAFCRRISGTFAAIAFDADTPVPKHFSVAVGIAHCDGMDATLEADTFMHRADLALCAAKHTPGRNIRGYWELDPANLPVIGPGKLHARRAARQRTSHAFVGLKDAQADPRRTAGDSEPR